MRKNIYTLILTGIVTAGLSVLFAVLLEPVLYAIVATTEILWKILDFWIFVYPVFSGVLCFATLLLFEKLLEKKFYTKYFYAVFYASVIMTTLLLMTGSAICLRIVASKSFGDFWFESYSFLSLNWSWDVAGILFSVEYVLHNVIKRDDRTSGVKHKLFCMLPFFLIFFFFSIVIFVFANGMWG